MPKSRTRRRILTAVLSLALGAGTVAGLETPAAATSFITANAEKAVRYASSRGETVAVAVLDTRTGKFYGAGNYDSLMATMSVAKVFIATELLLTGQMHGSVETTAYKMITQSDDNSANSLYGLVGADDVLPRVAAHYNLPDLGTRPSRPGWWGNTHIRAKAFVEFYAKVKADPKVGPWLLNAMHHASVHGSDGQYQYYGIPAATTGFAIKQGWGADDDCFCHTGFNSTGFVNGDRYAVALLTRGGAYGEHAMTTLNGMARDLIPNGYIDPTWHAPVLGVTSVTHVGSVVSFVGDAFDRDAPSHPTTISVYDNGRLRERIPTKYVRADINRRFGLTGRHGFVTRFAVTNGTHTFTLIASNLSVGANSRGTYRYTFNGNPRGAIESRVRSANAIALTGYAYDPDGPATSTVVQIRDNYTGAVLVDRRADRLRSDVNARFHLTGQHGFSIRVATSRPGSHVYCAYARNLGPTYASAYAVIGCGRLTVT